MKYTITLLNSNTPTIFFNLKKLIKMTKKLNAKQMAEREEFEQVNDLFAMLSELSDTLKCTSIFNGMTAASQAQFLNYCKEDNDVYIFYAYLS